MTEVESKTSQQTGDGRLILWRGQLTTPRRLFWRGWSFVGAPAGWLVLFLFLPSLALIAMCFALRGEYGSVEWTFSLANFRRLMGLGSFGWNADLYRIVLYSTMVAVITTVVCLLLAYPMAFFIATRKASQRYMLLGLIMVPFCTNTVVRVHGWKLILSAQFPLTRFLAWMGFVSPNTPLYPSMGAVLIGMISCLLPFAVLPLYTNIERLDWSLLEAARDLYAGRWRTFRHAILPQTIPGLMVSIILTFIPAMGMYVVTDSLGGGMYDLIGNQIAQQFRSSRDYPYGAAMSMVLMALTIAGMFVLRRYNRSSEHAQ